MIKIKAILLLAVLLAILAHHSIPHVHHSHPDLISESVIDEDVSQHHHGHSHGEEAAHHDHEAVGFNLGSLWELLIDIHAHGDEDHEINLVHFNVIKSKDLSSKMQVTALETTLIYFIEPILFEVQSFTLEFHCPPPPYYSCLDMRGPPSLG